MVTIALLDFFMVTGGKHEKLVMVKTHNTFEDGVFFLALKKMIIVHCQLDRFPF